MESTPTALLSGLYGSRALQRLGGTWLSQTGVGGDPRGIWRGTRHRLGVASRRREHCQSAVGKKGASGAEEATGSNPTDRGKAGCKRTLLTDAKGIPLAVVLCGANRHDSQKLKDVLEAVVTVVPQPQIEEQRHLLLDRGYDTPTCRTLACDAGFVVHIPKKASKETPLPAPTDPDRHPPRRWVVEVGHAWFNRFRRLQTRWEKRQALYLGFVELAACLIIWRKLAPLIT
ncbi:IS5 family transposase [Deinococcus rubellus]|uniref:IS5 family transposase n=1 Tax=Deinococcus rubellus TaxID=1889240 RepID=A0ABY5YGR3_9DEIO|nr:IS5 family transposase [Deinococcus rubellus]UWX63474.1 IS5 family transposase [Deinococcus rubellus]